MTTSKATRKLAEAEQRIIELKEHCEMLTIVLSDVEYQSEYLPEWLYSKVTTAMNAKPEHSLAKHDAETISDVVVDAEGLAQDYLDEILADKLEAGEL